ncbi:hypothetical protein MLD38_021822 [Melastoma candidum]|uniref:Uncharacterized protein n=1 Tax=Melastoma candidum TaxID=119954 RepID=A0ACB9QH80_9MYRT|nr:hypothetical protein MLD38_021822 [Melastoma candidum]
MYQPKLAAGLEETETGALVVAGVVNRCSGVAVNRGSIKGTSRGSCVFSSARINIHTFPTIRIVRTPCRHFVDNYRTHILSLF